MLCRYYTLTVKGVVFIWTVFAELQVLGCAHTKNATAPLDQSEQEETGGCSFDEERLSLLNLCVCMLACVHVLHTCQHNHSCYHSTKPTASCWIHAELSIRTRQKSFRIANLWCLISLVSPYLANLVLMFWFSVHQGNTIVLNAKTISEASCWVAAIRSAISEEEERERQNVCSGRG